MCIRDRYQRRVHGESRFKEEEDSQKRRLESHLIERGIYDSPLRSGSPKGEVSFYHSPREVKNYEESPSKYQPGTRSSGSSSPKQTSGMSPPRYQEGSRSPISYTIADSVVFKPSAQTTPRKLVDQEIQNLHRFGASDSSVIEILLDGREPLKILRMSYMNFVQSLGEELKKESNNENITTEEAKKFVNKNSERIKSMLRSFQPSKEKVKDSLVEIRKSMVEMHSSELGKEGKIDKSGDLNVSKKKISNNRFEIQSH
eukprot:TRINITY_DN5307_c0_g1_i4.p1 TRINITY_DN5307_c0_g1~~TRINITY_DN5307_c0_g1_i4.p1  ORF type:complete len:257 (+),score=47.01 TRINITY_DN5307_c0_g1_i4:146-916(+)